MAKLKPLKDQVIVITGASSGIGLVTARAAAKRGARVLLVARSGDTLGEEVRAINNAGGVADFAVADVGDLAAVQAAARHAIERFGRIDTWINDAGVAIYAQLLDTPDDEHRKLFDTNYFGTVHGCQTAVPYLREAGGALITVASIAADMPTPVMGAYAASKHAVKAYVEGLRIELAEMAPGIVVTLIKPSGIDTPIAHHAANHEVGAARIPPPAYDPDLVADAILGACEHPTRDLTVGGAGKAQVLFAQHFPALFQSLAPRLARVFVDKSASQPGPDNLFAPTATGDERSGDTPALKHSLYTAAAKRPGAVALGLGGIGVVLALLFARGRGRGER